jgi:hypothetical protein
MAALPPTVSETHDHLGAGLAAPRVRLDIVRFVIIEVSPPVPRWATPARVRIYTADYFVLSSTFFNCREFDTKLRRRVVSPQSKERERAVKLAFAFGQLQRTSLDAGARLLLDFPRLR